MVYKYFVLLSLFFWLTAGCAGGETIDNMEDKVHAESTHSTESVSWTSGTIQLPEPVLAGSVSLEQTLSERRSVRDFSEKQLTWEEMGQLFWAAQGITDPAGLRTAPSAGARYPLEMYVVTSAGVYHYQPAGHKVTLHLSGDLRKSLHAVSLNQDSIIKAPAVFLIAGVYQRTEARYGQERAPRYVHMEVGHAGQNLLLQAVALDLGAVIIGAFYDDQVKEALALPEDHQPLYLIPVGHPQD
jgi:SagB-type dehydrogenase family enzyme